MPAMVRIHMDNNASLPANGPLSLNNLQVIEEYIYRAFVGVYIHIQVTVFSYRYILQSCASE